MKRSTIIINDEIANDFISFESSRKFLWDAKISGLALYRGRNCYSSWHLKIGNKIKKFAKYPLINTEQARTKAIELINKVNKGCSIKELMSYKKHGEVFNKSWLSGKREVFYEMYGGECCLCGYKNVIALSLDHVNGDGSSDRKEKHTYEIILDAISNYNPTKYRILCLNCQRIEAFRLGLVGGKRSAA